jgi:hypothetical protein
MQTTEEDCSHAFLAPSDQDGRPAQRLRWSEQAVDGNGRPSRWDDGESEGAELASKENRQRYRHADLGSIQQQTDGAQRAHDCVD